MVRTCADRPITTISSVIISIVAFGGGGDFFLVCEDFGRGFDNSYPACAFSFFLSFFLFFKRRLARAHKFHSLGQDQSTVAQRAETTMTECLPDELGASSFPDRFSQYVRTAALSAHSDFTGSKVYVCLGVTCHLHF